MRRSAPVQLTESIHKLATHDVTVGCISSVGLAFPQLAWLIAMVVEMGGGHCLSLATVPARPATMEQKLGGVTELNTERTYDYGYSPTRASAGLISAVLGACMAAASAADAPTASSAMQSTLKPLDTAQFQPDDDVKCLSDALEAGDPARGPSTILLKATPGCVVPWHYHTAMEQVVVIRGRLTMEMTGHPATTVGPGGFAAMPGKVAHQFVCSDKTECLLTVMFDSTYDIFWVKEK